MRFIIPHCPECGQLAEKIEERMLTTYELEVVSDEGEVPQFEYTGEYDDDGESAEPNVIDGTVHVECVHGHAWRTAIEGQPAPDLRTAEHKALMALAANKMSLRWSYHKNAWVASMLHFETGNECQFVCESPEGAIAGAHKKATTPRKAKA